MIDKVLYESTTHIHHNTIYIYSVQQEYARVGLSTALPYDKLEAKLEAKKLEAKKLEAKN